jgi:hypothetical protein
MWWHAELFYARLYIRCSHQHPKTKKMRTIPDDILAWLTYHEMFELQTWRTTNYVRDLIQSYIRTLDSSAPDFSETTYKLQEQWQIVRNQEIEGRLVGYLGKRRPGYLERDYVGIYADFIKRDQELQREVFQDMKGNDDAETTIAPDSGQGPDPDVGTRPLL